MVFDLCCLMFAVRCVLMAGCLLFVCFWSVLVVCLRVYDWCLVCIVSCVLIASCCVVHRVECPLGVARCVLLVVLVCCVLFVVQWRLLFACC